MTTTLPSIFIDLGSSLLKVLIHHHDRLHTLLLSPRIANLSQKRLQAILDANPNGAPEDLCWLEHDNQLIAIGTLADSLQGDTAIKQRKMEPGLVRVLGILGILKDWLELPDRFECNLGIALPVAEYADRDSFAQHLQATARDFTCRGQQLSVTLNLLDIQIEGMGLVRDRRAELLASGKSPRHLNIIALMFGHRNLSILNFAGSTLQLETSTSSGPGFIKAVEACARSLALEPTTPHLTELVALQKPSYRFEGSLKPRDTSQAVTDAIADYWQLVANHLSNHLPGGDFEIVASGGAMRVIKPQLQQFFDDVGLGDRLSFATNLQDKLVSQLSDDPNLADSLSPDSALTLRLLDAFVGIQALLLKAAKRAADLEKNQPDESHSVPDRPSTVTDAAIQRLSTIL